MPELPEVEIMTRALGRWIAGRRLAAVDVRDPKLELDERAGRRLAGQVAERAWRRGKYAIVDIAGVHLVLHFRMTGRLQRRDPGQAPAASTRLSLVLEGGAAVDFVDPRRLGTVQLLDDAALGDRLSRLGPEPWPERHDGAWWRERQAGLRGPIKPALLRQDRVAGIGNILACEGLWRAAIDPRRRVPSLADGEWDALATAIPDAIDAVIAVEEPRHDAHGSIVYVNQGGDNPFAVYGREHEPCPRCGHPIARRVQSGRGTWWCPGCQR